MRFKFMVRFKFCVLAQLSLQQYSQIFIASYHYSLLLKNVHFYHMGKVMSANFFHWEVILFPCVLFCGL